MAAHLATRVYDPTRAPGLFNWALRSDVYLTMWILAWDVHALTTAPGRLFDANIFHPAPTTLALAEHMLGILPLYAPLLAISHDPVLAHQATLVLTFACAFLATCVLVEDWTGCWPAAIVAGTLYAFSPHRAYGLAGLQSEADFYLPLIPLCARRALVAQSPRWMILLAVVLVLQALASLYLAYAAFIAVAVLLTITFACKPAGTRGYTIPVVASVAVAAAVVAVATLPYLHASRSGAIAPPTREFLRLTAASLTETGAAPALLLALITAGGWRRGLRSGVHGAWIVGLIVVAFVGHALAVGPEVQLGGRTLDGPYDLLARVVPGFTAIRNPGRFNALASMGLSALAGVGVAGVVRSATGLRAFLGAATAIAVAGLAIVHSVPRTLPLMPVETWRALPPAYARLARAPVGPVVEVPFWDFNLFPFEREVEARRMYLSTYHWHPLLNGYSGYTPPSYKAVSALVRALPDPRARELLARVTGLRYVLVHRAELSAVQHKRWGEAWREFEALGVFGPDVLFRLRTPPPPNLVQALIDGRASTTTVLGTPLQPLATDGRQAYLSFATPPPRAVFSGLAVDLDVNVKNISKATWPALACAEDHMVMFAYRWEDQNGRVLIEDLAAGRLPYDLVPDDSVRTPVTIVASGLEGPLRLVLGLAQDGRWFDHPLPPISISVVRPRESPSA